MISQSFFHNMEQFDCCFGQKENKPACVIILLYLSVVNVYTVQNSSFYFHKAAGDVEKIAGRP